MAIYARFQCDRCGEDDPAHRLDLDGNIGVTPEGAMALTTPFGLPMGWSCVRSACFDEDRTPGFRPEWETQIFCPGCRDMARTFTGRSR